MTTSIKKSFNLFADLLIFIFELILFKIRKKNSPSSYKYMLRFFYLSITLFITQNILWIGVLSFIIFPIIVGIVFEISYIIYRKKIKLKKIK